MSNEKEEQLLDLGNDADTLLKNKVFNKTVNQLVEGTFQSFVNSKPEEKEVREKTYAHYRALVDIINTLQQRVSVKDEINRKKGEEEIEKDEQKSDNNIEE
tara:strand:+ start:9708 stop:10010 length:303 start_codon:yes stop_codon:yes gene_type:complete